MAQSFTATQQTSLADQSHNPRRRVLVTGAGGNIGSYFAEHSHETYQLRLMLRPEEEGEEKLRQFGEVVRGELHDLVSLEKACADIDSVLHLAADASPAAIWESLLQNNIIGTYNMFIAARDAGCRRLIYASSIHAVSGYPADVQVKTSDPVNPGDLYGVSKCFGEALARYMAEKEGLSTIVIRIGAFQPLEKARSEEGIGMLDAFVSQRDLDQLIHRCIDAEEIQFALVHGLSNNRFKRLDISDTRELLGYAPVDDLTLENPQLRAMHLGEKVKAHSVVDDREKQMQPTEVKSD